MVHVNGRGDFRLLDTGVDLDHLAMKDLKYECSPLVRSLDSDVLAWSPGISLLCSVRDNHAFTLFISTACG